MYNPDNVTVKRLLSFAMNGDLAAFIRFTEEMKSAGTFDRAAVESICHPVSKDTLAHLAARHGHPHILRYLHENIGCANFQRTNQLGKTALHEAAQSMQIECIEYLVSVVGVPVDCLKLGDWTPLMLSCTRTSLECVRALVHAGASLSSRNKDGWTAFHIACREGCVEIVSFLLDCDSNLWNTVSKNGRTPLHTAALHGRYEVATLLLSKCVIPKDQRDSCGTTPVMDAARADHVAVLSTLVSLHQGDVHAVDKMGRQALHLAAQAGSAHVIKYLIETHNVSPNVLDGAGVTALHLACKEGQIEVLEILLRLGADINLRDDGGRTALDAAVTGRRLNCAKLLIGAEY